MWHPVIQKLYDEFGIPNEHHAIDERGFVWFCGGLIEQKVLAGETRNLDGESVTAIGVCTWVAYEVTETELTLPALAYANGFASLNALCWERRLRTIRLQATIYCSDRNIPGTLRLVSAAMATQLMMVITMGTDLAASLGGLVRKGDPSRSPGPFSPTLLNALALFAGHQTEPSRFDQREFALLEKADPHPWLMLMAGADGFTAELPFTGSRPAAISKTGLETALLRGSVSDHPQLGTGLRLRLTLPVTSSPLLAFNLNSWEGGEWTGFHQLGAWSHTDDGLTFGTFIPANVYMTNLLPVLVWHAAARAGSVAREFLAKSVSSTLEQAAPIQRQPRHKMPTTQPNGSGQSFSDQLLSVGCPCALCGSPDVSCAFNFGLAHIDKISRNWLPTIASVGAAFGLSAIGVRARVPLYGPSSTKRGRIYWMRLVLCGPCNNKELALWGGRSWPRKATFQRHALWETLCSRGFDSFISPGELSSWGTTA
jgi:hypothetical protein